MEKLNVAVVGGNGVVGRAIVNSIDKTTVNIIIIDSNSRKPKFESKYEIEKQNVIFICVPTPTVNGEHDSSIIETYLEAFNTILQDNKKSQDCRTKEN